MLQYVPRATLSASELVKVRLHGKQRFRAHRDRNPALYRLKREKYYAENKDRISARNRAWRIRNADKIAERLKSKRDAKRLLNPIPSKEEREINRRIRHTLTCRIGMTVNKAKDASKCAKTMALVGCDLLFLRGFLEARFKNGMSWENYGQWHIDHVIPCAEFDLRDPNQQRQCFHYSNLQPLWATDNHQKHSKRPPTHQAELI